MAKTYRRTICYSGRTIDGRTVKPEWLRSAAASYSPEVYEASINLEHMRGLAASSEFGNYGKVITLSAEDRDDGAVALVADIELNKKGVAVRKGGEKPHWSAELVSDYPEAGGVYLSGLAMTNTPACGHTEPIHLSAGAPPLIICDGVLDDDALSPSFFTRIGHYMSLKPPKKDPAAEVAEQLTASIAALAAKVELLIAGDTKPDEASSPDSPAAPDIEALNARVTELAAQVEALTAAAKGDSAPQQATPNATDKAIEALSAQITQLHKALSNSESAFQSSAGGHSGNGSALQTDC